MGLYPIANIVCFIPATINRLYNIITKSDQFALTIIQSIFDYSLGAIITTLFVLSPIINYTLRSWYRSRGKKQKHITDVTDLSEDGYGGKLSDFNNSF
jgi:hypothetical protein